MSTNNLDPYGYNWMGFEGQERHNYLCRWRTHSTLVLEMPTFNLRCVREEGVGDAILIDPPCSGHDSQLVDWDRNQSLVQCALDNTSSPVYFIEYKSWDKTMPREGYEDIVNNVITCIRNTCTQRAHLVSLCQSGPVGAVIAATHQSLLASLTVVGSPINPHACDSVLKPAISSPMWMYEMIVGLQQGLMSGSFLIECWKSTNYRRHFVDRFDKSNESNYRKQRFDAWYYNSPLDICGDWYLECIQKLFKNNDLYEGRFLFEGEVVSLANISCPVYSVYGDRDDISPKEHAVALGDFVTNHTEVEVKNAGHISVFIGSRAIAEVWPGLFKKITGEGV